MRLNAPKFWYDSDINPPVAAKICQPVYLFGQKLQQTLATPYKASIPVICIGNITVGGSGKTPAVRAVYKLLREKFPALKICILSRGYGGKHKGPVAVDPQRHNSHDVGDEPLMLAQDIPVVVSRNRKKGAQYIENKGYEVILMDDGFQNPHLHKDISLLVFDIRLGMGNANVFPAGPLRQPAQEGLKNADAVILTGLDDGTNKHPHDFAGKTELTTHIKIKSEHIDKNEKYLAFCGIAHPFKFEETLKKAGINVIEFIPFPDHHEFNDGDLKDLAEKAAALDARLITTEKDFVRLPAVFKTKHAPCVLEIELCFESPEAVYAILSSALKNV